MTRGEVRQVIEAALSEVACEALDVAYCAAVHIDLRKRLPKKAQAEVYFRGTELRASAWVEDVTYTVTVKLD